MIAQILITVTIVVGDVAALLLVLILIERQRQARVQVAYDRRRQELLPVFIQYIVGDLELARVKSAIGLSYDEAQDILVGFLREISGDGRQRLLEAAAELGLLSKILRDLKHWDWTRRDIAAMRLGVYGLPQTVPDLAALLRDPRIEVRYTAARSLGLIGSPEAVDALVSILGYPEIVDTPRILEIVQIMGGQATEPLRRMLSVSANGHVSEIELLAIDLVGDLHDHSMIGTLHRMLRSSDTERVLRALKAIARIGAPSNPDDLLSLARDRTWEVRAQVARTIGLLQVEEGMLFLEQGLSDQAYWVRRNCAESLLAFGHRGKQVLETAVNSTDLFARDIATYYLDFGYGTDGQAAGDDTQQEVAVATTPQHQEMAAE
jgi:hypothetical protein